MCTRYEAHSDFFIEVPNQPGLLCVLNVSNPSARAADMDTLAGHGTCPVGSFNRSGEKHRFHALHFHLLPDNDAHVASVQSSEAFHQIHARSARTLRGLSRGTVAYELLFQGFKLHRSPPASTGAGKFSAAIVFRGILQPVPEVEQRLDLRATHGHGQTG